MFQTRSFKVLAALTLSVFATTATAADIAHVSSSGGYMLHGSGGAVLAEWRGQAPLAFTGYGQLRQGGQCLSGATGGQQLRWESCRAGDKGQIWALNGSKLNNELGWCADIEGGRQAPGARVLAYKCHGASNQQWQGHVSRSAQSVAAGIANPSIRAQFLSTVNSARAGTQISLATGQVIAPGGGNVVAPGGGNVVAAGGGNVVAAGGLN
jgi:hypothetical protein